MRYRRSSCCADGSVHTRAASPFEAQLEFISKHLQSQTDHIKININYRLNDHCFIVTSLARMAASQPLYVPPTALSDWLIITSNEPVDAESSESVN